MRDTSVSESPIEAHYAVATPILERLFGGTPLVWVTWPFGPSKPPFYHGELSPKAALHVPYVDVTTSSGVHRYATLTADRVEDLAAHGAIEFHGWSPTVADPSRAAFARLLVERHDPAVPVERLKESALALRALLFSDGLECVPVFDGETGIALWIPFADGPAYPDVRVWMNRLCAKAVAAHPDLMTLEPNTRGGSRVHLHVTSNAPGRHTALPYSARGTAGSPLVVPIAWPLLGAFENGSVRVGGLEAWLYEHGEMFGAEMTVMRPQTFGDRGAPMHPAVPGIVAMMAPASNGPTVAAAIAVLSDGAVMTADEILAEAVKRGLIAPTMHRKYVYTSLIEYIARANGNGRRPKIVQTEDRSFRINEPEDHWPYVAMPPDAPVSAATQAVIDRLGVTANGGDPAAFEQAVCDAFDALGFVSKHIGGQKAPDGYADAALGQLGYRVMIECKTGQYAVTHPDAFEAAKYKDAYGAAFCALVGSTFGGEIELTKELQNHQVAAFAVEDLQTLLRIGSNAYEMKGLFAPGFAADGLADLVWERHHGRAKRLRFIEETIVRAGWAMQVAEAPANRPADAAVLDLETCVWIVDQALVAAGCGASCMQDEAADAMASLAHTRQTSVPKTQDASSVLVTVERGRSVVVVRGGTGGRDTVDTVENSKDAGDALPESLT
jgi:DNA primase